MIGMKVVVDMAVEAIRTMVDVGECRSLALHRLIHLATLRTGWAGLDAVYSAPLRGLCATLFTKRLFSFLLYRIEDVG